MMKICLDLTLPDTMWCFPGGVSDKEPAANAGDRRDACSIPGLGRSPGGEHGTPVQYSCLRNPMDRGVGGLQSTGSRKESDARLAHV